MPSHRRFSFASWQQSGSRLAVAVLLVALLGGALPAPTVAAPKSITAWTHLAGTRSCLVLFDKGAGRVFTNRADDGDFSFANIYPFGDTLAGYTHLTGTGNHIFFYNLLTGTASGFPINAGCALSNGAIQGGFGTWTHVVGIGNQVVLFYNRATGAWGSGWLNSAGGYNQVQSGFLDAGWTHIAAAGSRVLFYKANTEGSNSMTGVFDYQGRFTITTFGGFATNWTHLAGTRNGGFIFYDKRTGRGMSGRLDANAA